jgi:uncharacterized protein (DUF1919 family)
LKIINFTDVAIYPNRYWLNLRNGEYVITIKTLVIENITQQHDVLSAKKTTLMLGDYVDIDFYFGHNISTDPATEEWVDIEVVGRFKVLEFISRTEDNAIEMRVKEVKSNRTSVREYPQVISV